MTTAVAAAMLTPQGEPAQSRRGILVIDLPPAPPRPTIRGSCACPPVAASGAHPPRVLKFEGKFELLVPALIIEEFDHNGPRIESAVTTSVLDMLRQLRRELRESAGDKNEHIRLAETAEHIPLVNASPQNSRRSTISCGTGRSSSRPRRNTRGRFSAAWTSGRPGWARTGLVGLRLSVHRRLA